MATDLAHVKQKIISSMSVNRNKIFLFLKIVIAGGLLLYIVSSIKISEITNASSNANYFLIGIVLIMLVPNVFLQYWKWHMTCNSILNCSDKKKIMLSLFQGFAAGAFTPFRLGEYFGRAFPFKEKTLLQVTIATVLDKFFPLTIVAFLGALSSILFIHIYYQVTIYITLALFILVFAAFYFLILLLTDPGFWNNFLFNKLREVKKLYRIFSKINFLKNLKREYLMKMFSVSLLFYFCFITQFVILVAAFNHQFNLVDYFWAAALVMFVKTFFPAVSLSELGIREGVSVFFLGAMGVNAASAFDAALFLFFINVLVPAGIGSVLLFKKNNV